MIRIRATRSPFQFMFMIASTLGGLVLLLLRQRIGSTLAQNLPTVVTVALGVGLVLAGGTTITGMATQNLYGLYLERAGLVSMGLLLASYTGFTVAYVGIRGIITAIFFSAIVGACIWRIRQIAGDIKEVQVAFREDRLRREGQ